MKRERVAFRDVLPVSPWEYSSPYYWFKSLAQHIRFIPREIGAFLERGWYGISWQDCWNLDSHLSTILPWAVRSLDHENNPRAVDGYPAAIAEELGPGKHLGDMTSADSDAASVLWKKHLETIARGFEAINERLMADDWDSEVRTQEIIDRGLAEFVKYYSALWD